MKITLATSVIDIFRNGLISTRVMNFCRRMHIDKVEDLVYIADRYGSLEKKFGPYNQTAKNLQVILELTA